MRGSVWDSLRYSGEHGRLHELHGEDRLRRSQGRHDVVGRSHARRSVPDAHVGPRAGVYDAPLLPRMQKLVATLPAYELLHVDFGEIAHAPPGYHAGTWGDRFGGKPAIANYLFYPQPTTMISTAWVPAGGEECS